MWWPLAHPLLGTWPTTQVCALTGNRTGDPLVCRLALNPHQPGLEDISLKCLVLYLAPRTKLYQCIIIIADAVVLVVAALVRAPSTVPGTKVALCPSAAGTQKELRDGISFLFRKFFFFFLPLPLFLPCIYLCCFLAASHCLLHLM